MWNFFPADILTITPSLANIVFFFVPKIRFADRRERIFSEYSLAVGE
jgi:hypothetical protein